MYWSVAVLHGTCAKGNGYTPLYDKNAAPLQNEMELVSIFRASQSGLK